MVGSNVNNVNLLLLILLFILVNMQNHLYFPLGVNCHFWHDWFLLIQVGQAPVCLKKEIDGFALNRVQAAIIAESWRLVQVSVCVVLQGTMNAFVTLNNKSVEAMRKCCTGEYSLWEQLICSFGHS